MDADNKIPDHQENVIADYANDMKQLEMDGYEKGVRKARNALFWAGGLIFLGEMISMVTQGLGFELLVFVIAIAEAGIFIGLAFWTKKKPFTAVVTGLIAFCGILLIPIIAGGIADGSAGVLKALFSGILVKVLILVNLILPLKDAKALQEAKTREF